MGYKEDNYALKGLGGEWPGKPAGGECCSGDLIVADKTIIRGTWEGVSCHILS
jgi:hypothetical protein